MPRKSTSSTLAKDVVPPISKDNLDETAAGATAADEGDASSLSVAEKMSRNGKTKVNGKVTKEDQESVGFDDLLLPRTLTSRLARGILPPNTSIQKDALLALTKAATVFISYLAHNANEVTQKKTVMSQDVLRAIQEIEMDNVMGIGQRVVDATNGKEMVGRLERELEVYENTVKGKRKGYREKIKARDSGVGHAGDGVTNGEEDDGGEREPKRPRYEGNDGENVRDPEKKATAGRRVSSMTDRTQSRRRQEPQPQRKPRGSPTSHSRTDHNLNGKLPFSRHENGNDINSNNERAKDGDDKDVEDDGDEEDEEDEDDDDEVDDQEDSNDNNEGEDEDENEDAATEEEGEEEEDEDEDSSGEELHPGIRQQADEQAELEGRSYGPDDQLRQNILNADVDLDESDVEEEVEEGEEGDEEEDIEDQDSD